MPSIPFAKSIFLTRLSFSRLLFLVVNIFLMWCIHEGCYAAKIVELRVSGGIGPATSDYVVRGIEKNQKANLILITLDTPGGLTKSTRQMTKAILSSPVPIVVYVAPSGARAASAGTYLIYASTIAAMAPGTHLGAASPIVPLLV
jgi:membrane-bound serine protease (ClpP class)